MKITCSCKNIIHDFENSNQKWHLISDSQWFDFWNQIDEAIEKSGPTKKNKEEAAMKVRRLNLFKTMWECKQCGRLHFNDSNNELVSYNSKSYNAILNKKL